MQEPVVPFDLTRMLWGDVPWLFALEIVLRTAVIYGWTLLLLRWIGGRSIAQLSLAEFLLVIALGSAVGDAQFYPDVPLGHAMLAVLLVVLADKAIDLAIRRWRRAKAVIDGQPVEVVRDGVIRVAGILDRRIGTMELMEMLRLRDVANLGQVHRAYLEASGQLSVFRADPPRPGLPIMPPPELEPLDAPGPAEPACCRCCGSPAADRDAPCPNCGDRNRAAMRPA